MADEVAIYIASLPEPARSKIDEIYERARELIPEAIEGVSYGMPTLLYKGKGLIAVMNTKKHIGIYPYGNVDEFAETLAAAGLDSTKGSIHLREGQDLPTELLERLMVRRKKQIDGR